MAFLFIGLALLTSLVSIGCWIFVLVKMFQNETPMYGIFGIICGLYALVWGWQNADKLNIRNIMMIWTACVILGIILNVAGNVLLAGSR
jgi:hypothetical protein